MRLITVLALLAPLHASAAPLSVPSQFATIQDAVDNAVDGDVIELAPGVYQEEVVIDGVDVHLIGLGGSAAVRIEEQKTLEIVNAVVNLTGIEIVPEERGIDGEQCILVIDDLYVHGGNDNRDGVGSRFAACEVRMSDSVYEDNNARDGDGAHIFLEDSSLVATNTRFSAGAAAKGGAVLSTQGSVFSCTSCQFDGNVAGRQGGAIFLDQGTGETALADTQVLLNQAADGGGGVFSRADALFLDGVVFDGNSVQGGSPGPAAVLRATAVLSSGTTIANHSADNSGAVVLEADANNGSASWDGVSDRADLNTTAAGSGGAFSLRNAASATFALGVFTNNSADDGGAIAVSGTGDLTVSSSEFVGNSGTGAGGSVFFDGGVGAITNTRFEGSSATSAGALFLQGSIGLLDGNEFLYNSSGTNGGAVVLQQVADLSVRFNTLCGNISTEQGGGIYSDRAGANGTLVWNNNVFAENIAGAEGGGLYLFGGNAPLVLNNTFIGNSAADGGSAWLEGTDFRFSNNIVSTSAGDGVSADPPVLSRNFELSYDSWFANTAGDLGGGLSTTTLDGTNVLADPDLMWSVDSCGVATYKPNVGSPVIDAGDPSILDPDGSRSDIGAYGGPSADPALYIDADADGFIALNDCDDTNSAIYPGAPEACDDVDSDCDGDLNDPDATGQLTSWLDADQDGFGDPTVSLSACFSPPGYVDNDADCDDTTPDITNIAPFWYTDADADGYGDDSTAVAQCAAPPGAVDVGGDCEDTISAINPAALEICNGVDDDCDGAVDTGAVDATPFYDDADGDGFGDSAVWVLECTPPPGTSANGEDCDDTNALINPSAPEVCDGVDDDCDGVVDGVGAIDAITWYSDGDLDGWGDTLTAVTECAPPSGFVDQGGDCNDTDATVYPFAPEDCASGVDSNCDGFVGNGDSDGDGVAACEDCDDGDPNVLPGADELCDGVDNNCDGSIDEDGATFGSPYYVDGDSDGFGDPNTEARSCEQPVGWVTDGTDCDDADSSVNPDGVEVPNDGIDQDCDGVDTFTDGIAPVEDVVASGKGCGCSSTEGSAPLGALLLTALLALRRRR